MASVTDLFAVAEAFLTASKAALNKTAKGAPERAFVAPGDPALDCCDQLTVHNQILTEANLAGGTGGLADPHKINRGGLAQATLQIYITRCVTGPSEKNGVLELPSPAVQQAEANVIDNDGWALWLGLNYALKHGSLHELCSGAERLGGQKLTPQGGCGGWVFTYRYPIEGGILP